MGDDDESIFPDVQSLLEKQLEFRKQILNDLTTYPISCLYDDECKAYPGPEVQHRTFQIFLRHIRTELSSSPRAVLLEQVRKKFTADCDAGGRMIELYMELGLPRDASAPMVAEAVAAVQHGPLYAKWVSAQAAATKPGLTVEMKHMILEGIKKKLSKQGLPTPTPEELAERLAQIQRVEEEKRAEHIQHAESLAAALKTDEMYQRYEHVKKLWSASGAEAIWDEYVALDRLQGEDRRTHGNVFEESDAKLAVALTIQALKVSMTLSNSCSENGHVSKMDCHDAGFSHIRGCEWRDRRNHLCGEVDIVVTHRDEQKSPDSVVVALIEMKLGWFELPAALLLQHASKLKEAESGTNMFLKTGSQKLPLSPSGVQIFVATLIPPRRFVLGIDPNILKVLCSSLYSSTPTDTENLADCGHLFETLRSDAKLQPRLKLSPAGLLGSHQLRSQIWVLRSNRNQVIS